MVKTFQIGDAFVMVNIGLLTFRAKFIAPISDKKMLAITLFHQNNAPNQVAIDMNTYEKNNAVDAKAALLWGTNED
jgi:hypothetical protein